MEVKERGRRRMTFTTVGGSSILTIFAVLCFVVFALLSLSTATANSSLTNKSIDGVTNYYKADTEAEQILAALRDGQAPVGVKVAYAESTKDGIKRIVAEGVGYTDWDEYAAYTCEISDTEELQVEVLLRFGENEGYRILKWKKVYTAEWSPDDDMPVYIPEDDAGGFITLED